MTTSKKHVLKNVDKTRENGGERRERVIASGARLTIETIAEFAGRLREELSQADRLVIDFAADVEVDITALQLFCSACATATAKGKEFVHSGSLPQSLLCLAQAAGTERLEQCNNNNMFCFRKLGGMK